MGQGWVAAGSLERITDSQLCASYARTMRGLVFAVRRWVWSFAKKDVFAFRDGLEGHLELCPKVFSRFGVFSKAISLGRHRGFRTQRATGLRIRSGATVFFIHRVRLERRPRLGPRPENLICKTRFPLGV